MSDTPTSAQIAQVQANLTNMQLFNDYVWTYGQAEVINAYLLLSEQDASDPGLVVGLNILEGAFWGLGSGGGPAGNFLASFLSGMVSWWATAANTPPSLNATFASLLMRLETTSQAVDAQLATYHQNVVANWDVQFTYNGQTQTLSDLANITVPKEIDTQFGPLAKAALFALDQQIWQTVLKAKYVVTLWELTSGPTILPGSAGEPPVIWVLKFLERHPAYYVTWTWHESSGHGDSTGWEIHESNIGTGASFANDGSMGDDACKYLFIDSIGGDVINPNGLFNRETVFTGLGINQTRSIVPSGGGGQAKDRR